MAIIGNNKHKLIDQVAKQGVNDIQQLKALLDKYEDLKLSDFKGVINEEVYRQLADMYRNPAEAALWAKIENAALDTPEQIQDALRYLSQYAQAYPDGPMANEAFQKRERLDTLLRMAIEKENIRREEEERERKIHLEEDEWNKLEHGNYTKLRDYLIKHPESIHKDEIDDLMWNNTKIVINAHSIERYLHDLPLGRHAAEATEALHSIGEWEKVKKTKDIFLVDDFRDSHPDSPFKSDIDYVFEELRKEEINKMKLCPSEYSKEDVLQFINADIFQLWELEDEGLVTQESWEVLQLDRELLPKIQEYQIEDEEIKAVSECTDIYLFGTPGTGKTCLLMGLTGANGNGYSLNMKVAGGPYASALQLYLNKGITPGRTFGRFVTTINGLVEEKDKSGQIIDHKINFVEMSGEEFAIRIADGQNVSLSNMGTGATNLMRNNNRKVFFIIVDCTKDMVKAAYLEQIKDIEGNVIEERIRKKYISQLDILNKFVGLFELDENRDIMEKVDAIHFIITKADFLGNLVERKEKAKELLLSKYAGPVQSLKTLCRKSTRINYATDYNPQLFTFSLGKFYLGDVFKFDPTETLQIIQAIRCITGGKREKTWWDKLKKILG